MFVESELVQKEGVREVERDIDYYSLGNGWLVAEGKKLIQLFLEDFSPLPKFCAILSA